MLLRFLLKCLFAVPSTAPKLLRLSAPSPTVISLSWEAPTYTNGLLLGYLIEIDPVGHPELNITLKEVPANATSWTFSQCQSSQLYHFSLSAVNADGKGPADNGSIVTPNPGNCEFLLLLHGLEKRNSVYIVCFLSIHLFHYLLFVLFLHPHSLRFPVRVYREVYYNRQNLYRIKLVKERK